MTRKAIDWEAIEIQYRAGIRSLKEIGAEFGVSDAGIIKRARRDGWTRDLRAKIQAKADAKVSAALVSAEVSAQTRQTERVIIEANAEAIAARKIAHRQDISRTIQVKNQILAQLAEAVADRAAIEAAIEEETAGDKSGQRRAKMLAAVSLPTHAGILKDLATTTKTLIELERQAFGMDEDRREPSETIVAGSSTDLDKARRVAFLLASGRHLITKGGSEP